MRSRTWFLISGMLFLASYLFWRMGNERVAQRPAGSVPSSVPGPAPAVAAAPTNLSLLTPAVGRRAQGMTGGLAGTAAGGVQGTASSLRYEAMVPPDPRFPWRLRNTVATASELARRDTGLLLANAFLDTAQPLALDVPVALRGAGDPGAYVVQSAGPIGETLRRRLAAAGAEVVSYIPNNAYLVRATAVQAEAMQTWAGVQTVLPYEPYFKLETKLVAAVVEGTTVGTVGAFGVTLFDGAEARFDASLAALGGRRISEGRSPFGPHWIIEAPGDALAQLAGSPDVHYIERATPRALLNDLARVRLGVAEDTLTLTNYLGLTGDGMVVNVNDSGVDQTHPGLKGRVFSDDTNSFTVVDFNGHGTHVAGTLAGDGTESASVQFADGSVTGADFRGQASKARIYALPIDLATGPLISDRYVQERAARAKAFVSNNSWGYPGANSYGTSSASYDAAVRDALPDEPGAQPLLYVFAAGNDGQGNDDGLGGVPGSIISPGTAKNVITVGAIENLRNITNNYITNIVSMEGEIQVTNSFTNYFFLGETDSQDQVASFSARGNIDIGTEGDFGRFKPDVVAPGSFVLSARSAAWTDPTNFFTWEIIKSLNDPLAPYYRYEGGTSMAAPGVSGVLVLMQEFFEKRLRLTNSPALMKALLINGARSVHARYSVSPRTLMNYQGWGLASLSNSIPEAMQDTNAIAAWPLRFLDQSASNAVTTGESRSWKFTLSPEAQVEGLRLTLVWTDPPGNPVAGLKLVNDLDLIVTNLDSGLVYYGNDIPNDSDFNTGRTDSEDAVVLPDPVNNVENVFIRGPLGSNYTVTVLGRRVNINAVTADTNRVAQDFALVASTSVPSLTNAFVAFEPQRGPTIVRPVVPVTNGIVLLHQRVAANFPLTNSAVGDPRQWNFYVFTNTFLPENSALTNGTNVAFLTFLPPNLGRPRLIDADIDLYVSTNSALTNLDAGVVASAFRSVTRGGNQVVFFTNAPLDTVYYVGVKSEDQQGAEFALTGISTQFPFDSTDEQGNLHVRGLPLFRNIPDGSPEQPGAAFVIGIATRSMNIGGIYVTNWITHENIGDLKGNLAHNNQFVVLNNHYAGTGATNYVFYYDDTQGGPYLDAFGRYIQPTDGPGSLLDFMGEDAVGAWILTMVDGSLSHTGRVDLLDITITPGDELGSGLSGTLNPNEIAFYYVDVPADATNLTVNVTQMTGPLNVYIRRGLLPDFLNYDKSALLSPPAGTVSLTPRDVPPLVGGRYFVAVFNPNPFTTSYRISVKVERSIAIDSDQVFTSETPPLTLLDDAITRAAMDVPVDREIVDVQVGVRIDHPRVADLEVRLVTPRGTRLLLSENRGGLDASGFGSGSISNGSYLVFSESPARATTPIKFAPVPFGSGVVTTQVFLTGFEGVAAREYLLGEVFDGWTVLQVDAFTNKTTLQVTTNLPVVTASSLADTGQQFLELGGARIGRDIPTEVGKVYYLRFRYWSATNAEVDAHITLNGVPDRLLTLRPGQWASYTKMFTATAVSTRLEIVSDRFEPGLWLDTFELADSGALYYQPEESMKELLGESAQGRWQLEITDSRVGPSGTPPQLLSWQLQFILAPPSVPTVQLRNGVPYTGSVEGRDVKYFVVETPRTASFATNLVFSLGDVVLGYSASGLPTGQYPGDVIVDNAGAPGIELLILNTNRPPLLVPGQRYYLAVANYSGNETNTFTIRVDFDRTDDVFYDLQRLTNGVPYTNTIPVTNVLDYYRFDVSPLATNVTFEVFPENGDVDLVVRKALPVPDSLPKVGSYDYQSANPGTNAESIVIDALSWPVPLEPGPWYLGVYNRERSTAVTYRIVATELLPPITPLTNGIPLTGRVLSSNAFEFYSFRVSSNATEATFRLFDATGDVDLLLRRGAPLPNPTNYHYVSANTSTNEEVIVVSTNSTPVALAAGDWYLTVTNRDSVDVTYSIVASEVVPAGAVPIQSVVYTNGTLCLSWVTVAGASYVVQGRVNVDDPAWVNVSASIAATGSLTSFCVPATRPERFFQVVQLSTGPGGGVDPTIDVASLTIVSNQLCLSWQAEIGAVYLVEGKARVDDPLWTPLSTNLVAGAVTMNYCVPLSAAAQYVRVTVLAGGTTPPPAAPVSIGSITVSAGRVTLAWSAAPNLRFQVEYAASVAGPWAEAGAPVTSTTGDYSFVDDGSATGGLGGLRFYRLRPL